MLGLQQPLSEFWRATPRELEMILRAHRRQHRSEQDYMSPGELHELLREEEYREDMRRRRGDH